MENSKPTWLSRVRRTTGKIIFQAVESKKIDMMGMGKPNW